MSSLTTNESSTAATPSAETQAMLECLREAVTQTLERKQRLGQYSAQWTPEGIRLLGPDAPGLPEDKR